MKKIAFQNIPLIFVFILALCSARPAHAHGNVPRLEISAERLNPGDTLQLRGVDFEYDQEIAVELVDSATHVLVVSMGKAATDIEGVFLQNIILPPDLPEGSYAMRAVAYDHEIFSPPFTVWGIPAQNEDGNVIRDQSDVQLEPITPLPPDMAPTAVPPAIAPSAPVSNPNRFPGLVFIFLGIGIFVVLGSRMIRKR